MRLPLACLMAAWIALCLPAGALALSRFIPEDAAQARLYAPVAEGAVQIGRRLYRLAPGLQIRDTENRIVQPASLNGTMAVRFTVDEAGSVTRIWILRPEELQ